MSREQQEEARRAAEETSTDPAIMASAASVLLSWYFFFLQGDRDLGLFVGLWPPTILAFASYFRQTKMSDMIANATTSQSSIKRSVQRMLEGQSR